MPGFRRPIRSALCSAALLAAAGATAAVPDDPREVNPVETGATAPDPAITTAEGDEVRLHSRLAEHPAVLVFYRGGWCPYCNRHLKALASVGADLRDLGYRIHAVSMDRPTKVADAAAEAEFDYALYSDADAEAAKAFGLAFRVGPERYEKLLGYGIDLEKASGREHHILPVPAVFLIGTDGRIRFRYYNPDYEVRLSADRLLEAAREHAE